MNEKGTLSVKKTAAWERIFAMTTLLEEGIEQLLYLYINIVFILVAIFFYGRTLKAIAHLGFY